MLRTIRLQIWRGYHHAAQHGSVDEMRALSLTFFEAAERLRADIEHRTAAGRCEVGAISLLTNGNATVARSEVQ
jgi:hypothetical protein